MDPHPIVTYEVENNKREKHDPSNFSSYEKFIYALGAKESKRQYPRRLQMFLDFINIQTSSIEQDCNLFYDYTSKIDERTSTNRLNLFINE